LAMAPNDRESTTRCRPRGQPSATCGAFNLVAGWFLIYDDPDGIRLVRCVNRGDRLPEFDEMTILDQERGQRSVVRRDNLVVRLHHLDQADLLPR